MASCPTSGYVNSNNGWNVTGCESFMNQPILKYTNEIRSAVLVMHGDKAHSCYFGKDAYADMVKDSKYTDNKELLENGGRLIDTAYMYHNEGLIPVVAVFDGGILKRMRFDPL